MKDPEFIELRNRFLLGIGICILFMVPLFFFLKNKLINDSSLTKTVQTKEEVVVLITKNKCDNCKEYQKILKNLKVDFITLNEDKDPEVKEILRVLSISKDDIISPTMIYIKEGNLIATLVEIKAEEEITTFVENYSLGK